MSSEVFANTAGVCDSESEPGQGAVRLGSPEQLEPVDSQEGRSPSEQRSVKYMKVTKAQGKYFSINKKELGNYSENQSRAIMKRLKSGVYEYIYFSKVKILNGCPTDEAQVK
ncbi:hypothetical protein DUI87_25352 [Hirundo rustica rustica]|uniref:Uncharacterized protein n=1 Tax=Hirundo rustica rustica TaxID=333673 RepID=A0A3M0JAL7_HIRRU|nr:hypothetical protein DUI87_25352 [Hirundo rustica rustica]